MFKITHARASRLFTRGRQVKFHFFVLTHLISMYLLSFLMSVLHKFGCLLGVWKFHFNPYGGLVHIKVRSHCLLVIHVECVSVQKRLAGKREDT